MDSLDDAFGAPLRRITVKEYERLAEAGILDPDEKLELLDGVIVAVSPQGTPQATVVERLNVALVLSLAGTHRVRSQLPMRLSRYSMPEPDFVVSPVEDRQPQHPRHALLIVEVADSSLRKDRELKLRLYAEAKVPEYWIINTRKRTIEVCRHPSPRTGTFRSVETFKAGATLKPAALPGPTIDVAALFA